MVSRKVAAGTMTRGVHCHLAYYAVDATHHARQARNPAQPTNLVEKLKLP